MADTHIFCDRSRVDALFLRADWAPERFPSTSGRFDYKRFIIQGQAQILAWVGGIVDFGLDDDDLKALARRFRQPTVITLVFPDCFAADARPILIQMLDDDEILVEDELGTRLRGDEFVRWLREHPGEFPLPSGGGDSDG